MIADPILAEVVRHGLQAIAEEMGAALVNTAHSVNIRDRRDFSCGVFASDGTLAAQAEHIPVHLGLLAEIVGRIEARLGRPIAPDEMIVTNDPWIAGSHLPDVAIVAPVDHGGERLGYVANMAHHVDVGGGAPGSLSLGAAEVFAEGLRVAPLTIVRGGKVDRQVVELFRTNSRTPDMVLGDLLAQIAANTIGRERLVEFVRRTGRARYDGAVAFLVSATAARIASGLAPLEGREAAFDDTLEWVEAGTPVDLLIRVRLTIADGTLTADFTGTAGAVRGPVNATRPLTLSCLLYVAKTMLDPEVPSNAGLLARLRLVTEPGSLVDAQEPAAVALCTSITSMRITDALIGAFNRLRPGLEMAASTGSMNALIIGGTDPATGMAWSYVETTAGGQGALADRDGADAVHCHMTNTANSPVEVIERSYPMSVVRYAILPGTGGAGRWRGGHGITREIRLHHPATVTVHLDRTRHRPWSIGGGAPGSNAVAIVRTAAGETLLPGKATLVVEGGAVIAIRTAGGGGWGDPAARDPEASARDVAEGLVPRSEEGA